MTDSITIHVWRRVGSHNRRRSWGPPMSVRSRRIRNRVTAALVVSALVVGAVVAAAAAAPAATGKARSKQVTVGADAFPPVLNNLTTAGLGEWTAMIAGPALARGYKLLPNFSYAPWLFDKDCTVTQESPFTVDCTIRPDAKW